MTTPFQFYQQHIQIGIYKCTRCGEYLEGGRQELDRHVKEHVGGDLDD